MSTNPIIQRVKESSEGVSEEPGPPTCVIGVRGDGAETAIGKILPVLPGLTMNRDELDPEDNPNRQDAIARRIAQHSAVWRQMAETGMSDQDLSDVPAIIYLKGITGRIAHVVKSNTSAKVGVLFIDPTKKKEVDKFSKMDVPTFQSGSTEVEDVLPAVESLFEEVDIA